MAVSSVLSTEQNRCPHCRGGFIAWDKIDREPYCYNCGWRRARTLAPEQVRQRDETENAFWLRLFAADKDPDEPGAIN